VSDLEAKGLAPKRKDNEESVKKNDRQLSSNNVKQHKSFSPPVQDIQARRNSRARSSLVPPEKTSKAGESF
jgi:hypothetical protein